MKTYRLKAVSIFIKLSIVLTVLSFKSAFACVVDPFNPSESCSGPTVISTTGNTAQTLAANAITVTSALITDGFFPSEGMGTGFQLVSSLKSNLGQLNGISYNDWAQNGSLGSYYNNNMYTMSRSMFAPQPVIMPQPGYYRAPASSMAIGY
ncbi:MAG: hypothetical protein ACPGJV_09540 [Bacteriovoracaceae bacterium]